jgi:DNA repair protein RecN (Recombination protein N)
VDIAGQHEHMSLFDSALHLAIVDRTGAVEPLLARYREDYRALREVERRIEELGGDERRARERADLLRFQHGEISAVAPRPGEDAELEQERRKLASADKLRRAAGEAEALLSSEDGAALDATGRAVALIADAARLDPGLADVLAQLSSAKAELEEGTFVLGRYLASVDADPKRLLDVEERLDALKRLCRRHGVDLAGLLVRQGEIAQELERWENRQELLAVLEGARAGARAAATSSAAALSRARAEAGAELATAVLEGLAHLAMEGASFEVRVAPAGELGSEGADRVELLFSANPGEPARPLAKVASGGEASRLLLALRRALAGTDTGGCYVLDEADAGVSGAVAEVVGRMIKEVSGRRQVLCITHLPQVAAFADAHLLIAKDEQRGRTFSRVLTLRGEDERRRELARMLSGVELTQEALGAAEALIRSAHRALQAPVV